MATPEQRRNLTINLSLAGLVATAVFSFTALRGDQRSPISSEGVQNTGTALTTPRTLASNGRDCEIVTFPMPHDSNQQPYITVPRWDAESIQAELDRGDYDSVEAVQRPCGDRGFIIHKPTETAPAQAPNTEQLPDTNKDEILAALDALPYDTVLSVQDKDGDVHRVKKSSQSAYLIVNKDGSLSRIMVNKYNVVAIIKE